MAFPGASTIRMVQAFCDTGIGFSAGVQLYNNYKFIQGASSRQRERSCVRSELVLKQKELATSYPKNSTFFRLHTLINPHCKRLQAQEQQLNQRLDFLNKNFSPTWSTARFVKLEMLTNIAIAFLGLIKIDLENKRLGGSSGFSEESCEAGILIAQGIALYNGYRFLHGAINTWRERSRVRSELVLKQKELEALYPKNSIFFKLHTLINPHCKSLQAQEQQLNQSLDFLNKNLSPKWSMVRFIKVAMLTTFVSFSLLHIHQQLRQYDHAYNRSRYNSGYGSEYNRGYGSYGYNSDYGSEYNRGYGSYGYNSDYGSGYNRGYGSGYNRGYGSSGYNNDYGSGYNRGYGSDDGYSGYGSSGYGVDPTGSCKGLSEEDFKPCAKTINAIKEGELGKISDPKNQAALKEVDQCFEKVCNFHQGSEAKKSCTDSRPGLYRCTIKRIFDELSISSDGARKRFCRDLIKRSHPDSQGGASTEGVRTLNRWFKEACPTTSQLLEEFNK